MSCKHLVALIMALAAAPPLSAQSVGAGIEAWQKADYAAAVAIWRPLADKGDADAAFNLGQAYRVGRGVPLDMAASQGWFERAARKGHLDAQAMLGIMLFEWGNRPGGLRWLKLAAGKGEPRAMLVYGTAMFNGDGMPRDPLLGYLYVSRAAESGLEQAKATLQRLDEILPEKDREKALQAALPEADETPVPAVEKPARKVPQPAPAAAAEKPARKAPHPAPAPAAGAWRIQLGAFSRRALAEALFGRLSGNAALSGRSAFYVPYGPIVRLQAGPFESRAAAQAACAALKPQPCFAIAIGKAD
ncbi:MAG: SPOR domain-containing protein [Sphingomicrobium sp.]